MHFGFHTPTKIIFGLDVATRLPEFVVNMGQRALVVTGADPTRFFPLIDTLSKYGVEAHIFSVNNEPTTQTVRDGIQIAIQKKIQIIVGIGGGSALDTAKAIAILLRNRGDPQDYLEVIGKGQIFSRPAAPYIAVPTTAGTGSEVTKNAVLLSTEHQIKASLRSPLMFPRLAIVDPLLTVTTPPEVTAQTGLDALTHNIEAFVCREPNVLIDVLCCDGIAKAARMLRHTYVHGTDESARSQMSLVSLYGGLALTNSKLGAVHGIAGPFGGLFKSPHGGVCARLLPVVMEVNVRALRERIPNSPVLKKYDIVAQILCNQSDANAEAGVAWIKDFVDSMSIRPLRSYGFSETYFTTVIDRAQNSNSMQGNPIELFRDELRNILAKAL